MNIAFLLDSTEISGRNRATLALADAMVSRGHQVRIVTSGDGMTWRQSRAQWVYLDELERYTPNGDELAIATSPSTVDVARRRGVSRGAYYWLGDDDAIPDDVPVLAAFERLGGKNVTFIGLIVDDELFRAATPREHEPLRVLLAGAAQVEGVGVDDGYGAVAHARWFHQKVDLIRVSPWAPSRGEPLDSVQEFHVALSATEMTRLIHSCDVVVTPHENDSAFSLVPLEALAAGIPALFTAIPSLTSFDAKQDYAVFAPPGNAVEIGERLIELLETPAIRERLRPRARDVAAQWRSPLAAERLERFLGTRSE